MRSERRAGPRSILVAIVLAMAGLGLAWLCFRTAAVAVLPPEQALVSELAPSNPRIELARAATALVRRHGILDDATLARVRAAAAAEPLDARAFLVLGHQQLLDRQPGRALKTLEAGQRLDPRNTLIHVLLLDRYLRTNDLARAAGQMSVLSRLLGETESAVSKAMAAMAVAPDTREAARRALNTDLPLEQAVLAAMARADVPPATVFAFASPAALALAGAPDGWGQALVARQIEAGRFAPAKAVWQRVYHVPPAIAGAALVNPHFAPGQLPPPFGWTLVGSDLGAADLRHGALAIDFYGRDSGDLASQTLTLRPGLYRFSFTVDAGKTDAASRLLWSLTCATGAKASLGDVTVVATASPHRLAGDFTVPATCPAQRLALRGEASDLPAPVSVSVRDLDLQPAGIANP